MKFGRRHLELLCLFLCLIGVETLYAQARRSINLAAVRSNEIKVLRSTGATSVAAGTTTVQLRPAELLFERLERPVVVTRSVEGLSRHELPYRLHGVSSSGDNLDLDIVIDVDGGRPRWWRQPPFQVLGAGLKPFLQPGRKRTAPRKLLFKPVYPCKSFIFHSCAFFSYKSFVCRSYTFRGGSLHFSTPIFSNDLAHVAKKHSGVRV